MQGFRTIRLACSLIAGAALAACGDPKIDTVPGEPELCLLDSAGHPGQCIRTEEGLDIDFGPVLLDGKHERRLLLRNLGRADLTLRGAVGAGENFSIKVTNTVLSTGSELELVAEYTPRSEGEHSGAIELLFTDSAVASMPVRLTGRGVKGGCVVEPSEVLQFGSVATGGAWTTELTIRNGSDLAWALTIGEITSDTDEGAFSFEGIEPGEHLIEANGELAIPITFRPNHVGEHVAQLSLPAPALCPSVIRLTGYGVEQVLTWDPPIVDFGYVHPNSRVTRELTFRNVGNAPVQVSELAVAGGSSQFSLEDPTLTSFEVPAFGGERTVVLAFQPPTLGDQRSTLGFRTDSEQMPNASVPLRGYGGGPDIAISPKRLDFGQVGIGTWQSRRLVVANVGTDAPGTDEDNLRLGNGTAWYQWEPATGHDLRAELDGYSSAGLRAGSTAQVRVTFTPLQEGIQQATLKIFSNDPDEPVVEIEVIAEGANLPPCEYEVVPPQVRFGYVEPGRTRTQSFHITNTSPNACIVSTLDLYDETDSFKLANPPQLPVTIAPGDSLEVPVLFWPQTAAHFTGRIEFFVNSYQPLGVVLLDGTALDGCLLIAPNDLDFGVNKVNCSARDRSLTIYNSCSSPVTLDNIAMQAGLSSEFSITQRPALPYVLQPGHSVEFKTTYRPTDVGQDTATIAVQTRELTHPYLASLTGQGAHEAIQTDIFAQDPKPRMDILFVVDDSCSMDDEQASLGQNFAAFLTYAMQQEVDYRIAVTTTTTQCGSATNCSKGPDGRFVPSQPLDEPNPAARVITPMTPKAEELFAKNVDVGTGGNGFERPLEAAMLALEQDRLLRHNAGFLRPDAYLAIVIVTDARDQSPNTVGFYYNYFLNVVGFRRANQFSISGIIPTAAGSRPGCSYDESTSGQDTRLRDIIALSGGLYDDICTTDWSKTLEELGQRIFGHRTRFFLHNTPDLSQGADSFEVFVDDMPYPSKGPMGDVRWTYDPVTNSIDFDPLTTPEPGATLRVIYRVACEP